MGKDKSTQSGPSPVASPTGPQPPEPRWNPVTVATVVIAVATAASVYVMDKQWDAMQDQLRATQDQLTQSERTFRIAQRPWLVVSMFDYKLAKNEPPELTDPNGPATFHIEVKNVGTGPAIDVRNNQILAVGTAQPPDDIEAVIATNPPTERKALVGGGLAMVITHVVREPERASALRARDHPMVFFGRLDYMDQFGTVHYTPYCAAYQPDIKHWIPCATDNRKPN